MKKVEVRLDKKKNVKENVARLKTRHAAV